ncbi:hypothetical protein BCAH1134_C0173 (plasmid) [Bacillus cereus AH1134]|nr:hypothetical protein BCAH1134_C0173 [Bacillus cereus AH1134]PEE95986.1 hypothetical protein COM92_04485 [Bacillus cereus]PGN73036.1 hypothetical protein CN967_22435 [Bacillus cereus]
MNKYNRINIDCFSCIVIIFKSPPFLFNIHYIKYIVFKIKDSNINPILSSSNTNYLREYLQ